MRDWFTNDELFRRELEEGYERAEEVAAALRDRGFRVDVTPLEWRRTIEDRHEFRDEFDLKVGTRRPCRIDVKSRRLEFSGPADYPYRTALVDTVPGWESKARKPVAIVLVSQFSGGLAVVRASTRSKWTVRSRFDTVRQIKDDFYEVDRRLLASFNELVAWLERRERRVDEDSESA